jgi:hypothetical protein
MAARKSSNFFTKFFKTFTMKKRSSRKTRSSRRTTTRRRGKRGG